MRTLIIRPRAQTDLVAAASWYEQQRAGLAGRFLDEVERLLHRMRTSPQQFPEIEPGIRRGLLHRFPYSVYFSADEQLLAVIAVLHQHRHPDAWRRPQ